MEFKLGKTCSGCDQIVKNLNKLSNAKMADKVEDTIGGEVVKADVGAFIKKTTGDAEKTSKQLVKKMKENAAKVKAPKVK